jgi:hypothetical protein
MKVRITMTGTSPLLLHNVRLASPLDPYSKRLKALNSKRNKTEDDRLAVARLEWEAGWYWDDELGPILPTASIRKCLIEGARLTKAGKKIERGVTPLDFQVPLVYNGPRDLVGLWGDGIGTEFVDLRSAVVQRNKVDRCRPKIRNWSVSSDWLIDPSVIELDEFAGVTETAGAVQGVGDARSLMHGRFDAKVETI